jgi:hypothetical protein
MKVLQLVRAFDAVGAHSEALLVSYETGMWCWIRPYWSSRSTITVAAYRDHAPLGQNELCDDCPGAPPSRGAHAG